MSRRAAAHQPRVPIEANRELFDAIEYAATEGRLDLRDLTDAYNAGVPEPELSDGWDAVEEYLQRICDVQNTRSRTRSPSARGDGLGAG